MTERKYRRVSLFLTVATLGLALPSGRAQADTATSFALHQPTGAAAQGYRLFHRDGHRGLRAPVFPQLRADTVITTPAPSAPAQVTPVVQQQPAHVVHSGTRHNYMATMAWSAIMGGVLGAAIGAAVYYLDDGQPAKNIAYWAAGGVLVGTGVGLIQIMVEEGRTDRAVSRGLADPAPTFRLALYRRQF